MEVILVSCLNSNCKHNDQVNKECTRYTVILNEEGKCIDCEGGNDSDS